MRVMLMIKGDPQPGAAPSEELLGAAAPVAWPSWGGGPARARPGLPRLRPGASVGPRRAQRAALIHERLNSAVHMDCMAASRQPLLSARGRCRSARNGAPPSAHGKRGQPPDVGSLRP
jgi:hypothetical protein